MRFFFAPNNRIFQFGVERSPSRAEAVADGVANEKLLQSRRCLAEADRLRVGAAQRISL
jgi:hypothetical protein